MLIMMLPILIPLVVIAVSAIIFIQWLIWIADEEAQPANTVTTIELKAKARKLAPISSPTEIGSVMSNN